jgi:hypothetical protein
MKCTHPPKRVVIKEAWITLTGGIHEDLAVLGIDLTAEAV